MYNLKQVIFLKGYNMTKLTVTQTRNLDLIVEVMSGNITKAGRRAFDQLMENAAAAAAAKKPQ